MIYWIIWYTWYVMIYNLVHMICYTCYVMMLYDMKIYWIIWYTWCVIIYHLVHMTSYTWYVIILYDMKIYWIWWHACRCSGCCHSITLPCLLTGRISSPGTVDTQHYSTTATKEGETKKENTKLWILAFYDQNTRRGKDEEVKPIKHKWLNVR